MGRLRGWIRRNDQIQRPEFNPEDPVVVFPRDLPRYENAPRPFSLPEIVEEFFDAEDDVAPEMPRRSQRARMPNVRLADYVVEVVARHLYYTSVIRLLLIQFCPTDGAQRTNWTSKLVC
jgi:hypothetical protein